jgi:hypothetical protein
LSLSSQKYEFGIHDPGSEIRKNLFRIPDTGVKKAPDPGSGSATLLVIRKELELELKPQFVISAPGGNLNLAPRLSAQGSATSTPEKLIQ